MKIFDDTAREAETPAKPPFVSVDDLLRELVGEPDLPPAPAPEPSLPAGTVVGRFELLREVGRGGFGIVYEARDRSLGRRVAFKLVRGGRRMEERRERLLHEAEAAARLSHPNVVTLFDLGSSEHGPYLILELLEGETLGERLRREPMALPEVADVAIQMTKGLAHAHAAGVIHGDVTPGNVYLCSDGRVKVLDLGLARVFGSSGSGGGTRGYMAPELKSGAPVSERTDIFALGVVLFRMVTGHLPYRSDDEVHRPRLRFDARPALAEAIEHMLEPEAADRPRDATEVLRELEAALEGITDDAPVETHTRRPTLWLAAGALVITLVVAGVIALRGRGGSGSPPSRGAHTIAVLPFADRSPDHDQEYLADGVTDQLRAALTGIDRVSVIGRDSSRLAAKNTSLVAAARALGATALLGGSTSRVGNRVEVGVELRDAAGDMLWSRTYRRPMTDIFSVQDDVAANAVRVLALASDPPKQPPRVPASTSSEGYTEFLKGRQHQSSWTPGTPENTRKARQAFERALALDPAYAPAWAALASALLAAVDLGDAASNEELRAVRRRTIEAAEKAVTLSPDLSEAWSTRGLVREFISRDWSGAMSDLSHAIALAPNDVVALRRYSSIVASLGRVDDALAAAEKAASRDPLNAKSWVMVTALSQAKGDLDGAERAARRAVATSNAPCVPSLGYTLILASKPQEALASFKGCPEPERSCGTAMAEHSLGHRDRSRAALDPITTRSPQTASFMIAQVHAWRGEKDLAFEWLDKALANEDPQLVTLRWDPFLGRLKGDPRYATLLRKLQLPAD